MCSILVSAGLNRTGDCGNCLHLEICDLVMVHLNITA